jgi:integrase
MEAIMASLQLKYDDIYYCSYFKANGTRTSRSTKIRVSVYGSRKARQLAEQQASEWERRELNIKHNRTDFISVLDLVECLDRDDKVKLAVILSSHLPSSVNGNGSLNVNHNNNTISYPALREEWLALISDEKSDHWIKREISDNRTFIEFLESKGISLITDIKVSTINDFIKSKKDEGKAPNTITNYLKPVSQCIQHAVNNEYLVNNPVLSAHKPGTKVLKEFIYISDEILDQVIDGSDSLLDRIYWTILRYTGLNPVDVSSLTSEAILGDNGGRYIDGKRTKSKVSVRIPLHSKIEALIEEHGVQCFGVYKKSKNLRDGSTKRFKKAVYVASDGKIETSLGSLRHTFATNLFNQGYSLDEIKLITGHTTTKLLAKTYVKEADQVRAHEAIDKLK